LAVFFNILTNVERMRVNENMKEIREKLCSFTLFDRIVSGGPKKVLIFDPYSIVIRVKY
jgi:hypothetical protein